MKVLKMSVLLVCCVLVGSRVAAQRTSSDSLAVLYQNYFRMMARQQKVADSLQLLHRNMTQVSQTINGMTSTVDQRLERLNDQLTNGLETVGKLTKDDLLTKDSRLKTQKQKILSTSVFIKSANNSFDAIDAALAQSDYLGDVGNLNSPTNTELGFSLSDEISQIMEKTLIKGNTKFAGNASRFLDITKQIIQNPIVTSIASTIPALSSINAVVNLVSTVAITERKVEVSDLVTFNRELQKYIVHYEGLGKANYEFNSNIEKLKVKTNALRDILTAFTVERIKTITPDAKYDSSTPLHRLIADYYEYQDLTGQIDGIIANYKDGNSLNYRELFKDTRLDYPYYATNQAQFIQQELESISGEYIATYLKYHSSITRVLTDSKSLSKEPAKIDNKITQLSQKLTTLVDTFKKNVKIGEVTKNFQRIPTL